MNPEKSIVVCISYEWKQELVINRKLICSDVYSIFPSWLQLITNISALRFPDFICLLILVLVAHRLCNLMASN